MRQGDGGDEGDRGEVEGAERDRQGGMDGQGCPRQGPVRKLRRGRGGPLSAIAIGARQTAVERRPVEEEVENREGQSPCLH